MGQGRSGQAKMWGSADRTSETEQLAEPRAEIWFSPVSRRASHPLSLLSSVNAYAPKSARPLHRRPLLTKPLPLLPSRRRDIDIYH